MAIEVKGGGGSERINKENLALFTGGKTPAEASLSWSNEDLTVKTILNVNGEGCIYRIKINVNAADTGVRITADGQVIFDTLLGSSGSFFRKTGSIKAMATTDSSDTSSTSITTFITFNSSIKVEMKNNYTGALNGSQIGSVEYMI